VDVVLPAAEIAVEVEGGLDTGGPARGELIGRGGDQPFPRQRRRGRRLCGQARVGQRGLQGQDGIEVCDRLRLETLQRQVVRVEAGPRVEGEVVARLDEETRDESRAALVEPRIRPNAGDVRGLERVLAGELERLPAE